MEAIEALVYHLISVNPYDVQQEEYDLLMKYNVLCKSLHQLIQPVLNNIRTLPPNARKLTSELDMEGDIDVYGDPMIDCWYNSKGQLHRICDKPALVNDELEIYDWYINDIHHRLGKPASIWFGDECYFIDGEFAGGKGPLDSFYKLVYYYCIHKKLLKMFSIDNLCNFESHMKIHIRYVNQGTSIITGMGRQNYIRI